MSAGCNTALFSYRGTNEANIPTLQDAPRSAPRFPRPERYAGWSRSASQSQGARPQAPFGLVCIDHAGDPRRTRVAHAPTGAFVFGRERRLTRSEDFERLMKAGTRRAAAGFVFFFSVRERGPARLGILISRRHARRASDRNRIKRCIREAFRQEHPKLAPIDVLVRPPYGLKPDADTGRRLRELMLKLGK